MTGLFRLPYRRRSNLRLPTDGPPRPQKEDYDRKIVDWKQKSLETDYNMVFYSLAFFTLDWKYAFEFAYILANKMEQIGVKEVDRDFYSILCARMTDSNCSILSE